MALFVEIFLVFLGIFFLRKFRYITVCVFNNIFKREKVGSHNWHAGN